MANSEEIRTGLLKLVDDIANGTAEGISPLRSSTDKQDKKVAIKMNERTRHPNFGNNGKMQEIERRKIGVRANTSDFRDEVQTLYYLVSEGAAVFKGQAVAIVIGTNKWGKGRTIIAPEDGVVTELHCGNGAWLQFSNNAENYQLTNEQSEYELVSYTPLPQAIEHGLIEPSDPSQFLIEIKAPLTDSYFFNEDHVRLRCNGNGVQVWWSGFVVVEKFFDPKERAAVPLIAGDKIISVMPEEWHKRFSRAMEKKAEATRLKDKVEILKDEKKQIDAQIGQAKKDLKRHETQSERAKLAAQDAEQVITKAEATAAEIVRGAERKGEASATAIVTRLKQEAEEKAKAILESARQQRGQAIEAKKAAAAEALQTIEAAKREAHAVIATAQADAKAERKAVEQNAAKLKLDATVKHLYALQASGELPEIMERPTMRRLYLALGELLVEAQGFAAPETVAQMANQNRMDEIKAMNNALAKEIRDTETNDDWPDVVKERHIEMLLDMTDAKGGSIVKNAVDDG